MTTIKNSNSPAGSSVRDWPEDFADENGNYMNRCMICERLFAGHKRRTWCKACAGAASAYLKRMEPIPNELTEL